MADAVLLVDIDADRKVVREALTTQEAIRSWWTSDAEVSETDLSLGFPEAPARFALRVDDSSDDRVVWSSVGEFPPHWVDTTITWSINDNPAGGGSQVFFGHEGFAAADPMLGHTSYTWAQLMPHLKQYAETGSASPFFG